MSENPGEYNRAFRIEERSGEKDSSGQLLDAWVTVHPRLWGKFRGESGMATIRRVGENEGDMTVATRCSLRLRYRTDINVGMRAVHIRSGRLYDIQMILPDEAGREYVDLVCEVGGNDG